MIEGSGQPGNDVDERRAITDFMKTYGASVREDEESPNLHRAEDLWSLREFTYPTNTVEPTTGVPAVAAGWRTAKAGGKRVFCDERGLS